MCRIKQSKRVLAADFSDGKVILNLATYISHTLNPTASEVWDFCKRPRKINEIIDFLHKRYNIDPQRARKDIKKLIGDLKKRELIQVLGRRD